MLHFAWDVEGQPFTELTSIKLLYELAGLKEATPLGEFFFYDEWWFCQHYVFNLVMFLRFFLEHDRNWEECFLELHHCTPLFFWLVDCWMLVYSLNVKNHIDRGSTLKISCFFNFLLPILLLFLNVINFKCKKS